QDEVNTSEPTYSGGARFLRYDADFVVEHLHEAAADIETATRSGSDAQLAVAKQRHQGRMTGENSNLAVVGGGDYRIRLPLEQHRFGRDNRDFEHQADRRLAASTTPSMPPCMK